MFSSRGLYFSTRYFHSCHPLFLPLNFTLKEAESDLVNIFGPGVLIKFLLEKESIEICYSLRIIIP